MANTTKYKAGPSFNFHLKFPTITCAVATTKLHSLSIHPLFTIIVIRLVELWLTMKPCAHIFTLMLTALKCPIESHFNVIRTQ